MFETEGCIISISQAVEYLEHFDSSKFWLTYKYMISDDNFPTISGQEIPWSINSKEDNVLISYDFLVWSMYCCWISHLNFKRFIRGL